MRWFTGCLVLVLFGCSSSDNALEDSGSSGGSTHTSGGASSGGSAGSATAGSGGASTAGSAGSSAGTTSAGTGGQTASGGAANAGSGGTVAQGGAAEGEPGVWENVTPEGVSLDQANPGGGDNYGVQDVLADPARPTDLYAFICYQGVWRSTDYGSTWTQTNPGSDWGKPWGSALDPNPARDASTSPMLYAGGSNAVGFHRSSDFGVTWSTDALPDAFGDYRYQQVYSVDVDPYDNQHLIVAFHEAPDVAESTDAGVTWTKWATPAADGGSSYYPFFINTGDAETTRKTWLTIPQQNGDARALRTTDGGANWIKLNQFQHHHGSAEIVDAGAGLLYVASMSPGGVHKSTDFGATWSTVLDGDGGVIAATSKSFYTTVGLGWGKLDAPIDPNLYTAARNGDDTWTKATPPSELVDGAKRLAVTSDGTHNIVVGGFWHAGIWRYIEP